MSEHDTTIPPRPRINDPAVIDAAARNVLIPIIDWLGEEYDPNDSENVLNDIRVAIKDSEPYGFDAYGMAKRLEEDGWVPDTEMVGILDAVQGLAYNALAELEAKWAKESGARLARAIGDTVNYVDRQTRKSVTAEVVNVYPDRMKYLLWHSGLKIAKDRGGIIVNAEEVTA